MRHGFTLIELLVVIAIIAVLCALVPGPGLDSIFSLVVGCVRYPWRLAHERDVNWSAVLLCVTCLAGLTLGVHYFGRWFASTRATPTTWPWTRTLKLIGLLMLMFIAGITAIGITHEVVWMATTNERLTGRTTGAHTQNRNNLTQIAVAAHNHNDQQKLLPAGAVFDTHGRALHGWQTALLPYIERAPLHQQINFAAPWNSEKNAPAMKTVILEYVNPFIGATIPDNSFAPSHYAANVHVLGARPMPLADITDGTSNTLLFGEVAHGFKPWGMPLNCRDPSVGLNTPHGFANPRGQAVVVALADGSVRTIRADISPEVLKALSTPRDGEKVDFGELDR